MKNAYVTYGDVTLVYVNTYKDGQQLFFLIDTLDLPHVSAISGSWSVNKAPTNQKYYVCTYMSGKDQRKVYLHRYLLNPPHSRLFVDHIDHNPLNNRRSNLRLVTDAENKQNRSGAYKTSKTGIRGVTQRGSRWIARITVNGKGMHIGSFETAEEAEEAVIQARIQHFAAYVPPEKHRYLPPEETRE